MDRNFNRNTNDEFRINLQMFAEDGGTEPANDTVTETAGGADEQTTESVKTFTQAELDKMIQQRLEQAKRGEAKRIEAARQEGRSEAEKLAKMTEDERRQHAEQEAAKAMQDRLNDLDRREREIVQRELKSEAINELNKRGLDPSLVDVMTFTDADSCKEQINAVEKAFRTAVNTAVDARLRQSGVTLRSNTDAPDPDKMSDAEWFAARRAQRNQK